MVSVTQGWIGFNVFLLIRIEVDMKLIFFVRVFRPDMQKKGCNYWRV